MIVPIYCDTSIKIGFLSIEAEKSKITYYLIRLIAIYLERALLLLLIEN